MTYSFTVPQVAKHFPKPDGKGAPGNAIRSWCRRGVITGFRQRQTNAAVYLNSKGVLEAWRLWAEHKGLDPEADMPKAIKAMVESGNSTAPSGRPTVRIIVPPGVSVEVEYAA